MTRAALTVQQVIRDSSGLTPVYGAPAQTDLAIANNDGRIFLHVKNSNAATRTVTVATPGQVGGLDIADLVATIPANTGDKLLGPFPPDLFNQADGSLYVDVSATAGLTLAVLRL